MRTDNGSDVMSSFIILTRSNIAFDRIYTAMRIWAYEGHGENEYEKYMREDDYNSDSA